MNFEIQFFFLYKTSTSKLSTFSMDRIQLLVETVAAVKLLSDDVDDVLPTLSAILSNSFFKKNKIKLVLTVKP